MNNDYWRIEFNEVVGNQKSYKGEIVTKEILNEIQQLDEKWHLASIIKESDEYAKNSGYNIQDSQIDDLVGYAKFYFEHIQDGEVIETIRIEVGDGNSVNKRYFDYIQSQLNEKQKDQLNLTKKERKEKNMSDNNVIFLPITAKQVVKRNIKNKTKQGGTYYQHKILIGHGKHKGKSLWIHANHLIEKEKINKTTLESFISCAVLLNLNNPIKLYEHGINQETGKLELKSTTIISNIAEFVQEIIDEKQKKLEDKIKHKEEKEARENEQEEELER